MQNTNTCNTSGCTCKIHAKGLCRKHYAIKQQAKRVSSRKSLGLCVRCGRKLADKDRTYCSTCRKKRSISQEKINEKRIKMNLCVQCGQPAVITADTLTFCETCYLKKTALCILKSRKMYKEIKLLLEEQKFSCAYSGRKIILGENNSLDHIIPRSAGGEDILNNIFWADFEINRMKHDLKLERFLDLCMKVVKNAKS